MNVQVFSKEWFDLHQRKILWLANTRYGRWLLRVRDDVPKGKKLTAIGPCHITWEADQATRSANIGTIALFGRFRDAEYLTTDFRADNKFAKRLYHGLKPFWFLVHGWDLSFGRLSPQFNLGFDTLTAYPAVGSNSPVNGVVSRNVANESFANMSNGNGDSFTNDPVPGNNLFYYITHGTTNNFSGQTRSVFCFDTSVIGGGTISAAILSLYGSDAISTTLGTPNMIITAVTTGSSATLAGSDYQGFSYTAFSTISGGSWINTGYNDFTLDSNGRANINKAGISKFGGTTSWDAAHSFGGTWAAGDNYNQMKFSNETGTSKDPKLVVTYSNALPPFPFFGRQAVNRAASF